jgi:hypothetical protein
MIYFCTASLTVYQYFLYFFPPFRHYIIFYRSSFERPICTGCRSSITNSPVGGLSSENVVNGEIVGETAASTSDWGSTSLKVPPVYGIAKHHIHILLVQINSLSYEYDGID